MPSFWIETNINGSPQNIPFNKSAVIVGRGQGVDLLLEHPTVSRQHGQIVHDPMRGYRLVVMSRGGMTAVDGAQVQGEVPLYNGSQIHFGQMSVVFRANDAAQKPGASGGFGQQAGGFGQQPGSFGQQQQQQPAAGGFGQQAADSSTGGLGSMSLDDLSSAPASSGKPANVWEEIAASAEAMDEDEAAAMSDDASENDYYARMQAAQARGEAKSKGVNPLLIIGVIGAVGFMAYSFLFTGDGGDGKIKDTKVAMADKPPIELTNVSCLGEEDCVTQATSRFNVGKQLLEKKEVHISNLFEGYKKMLEVQALLEAGKVKPPAELAEAEALASQSRSELDRIFREQRLLFHKYGKRGMHEQQIQALDTINSYFPDKTTPEYQWSYEKEVELKNQGVRRR